MMLTYNIGILNFRCFDYFNFIYMFNHQQLTSGTYKLKTTKT